MTYTKKDLLRVRENLDEDRSEDSFSYPCPNDNCPAWRVDKMRVDATAWKAKNGGYEVFCHVCGQTHKFTQKEMRQHNGRR